MSLAVIGLLGFVGALVLILLRTPVGIALGVTGITGLFFIVGWRGMTSIVSASVYEFSASWSLSAIPLFLLTGAVLERAGLVSKIFRAAKLCVNTRGGLALATMFASAGFAALSGSSLATAAMMSRMAMPEMIKAGYDKRLAAGCVASAGTLGSLIPPSVLFVLYGLLAEVSIRQMVLAGLLPGLLTMVIYILTILSLVWLKPELAPSTNIIVTIQERRQSLIDIWPLPVLFAIVVGGIYSGLVTVTEAAAVGALVSIVYGIIFGRLRLKDLWKPLKETLESSAQIFFIAIGAVILTRFLAVSGLSPFLVNVITESAVHPVFLFATVSLMFVILGMFLDPIGMLLLTIPIVVPIFDSLGYNLIYLGVIVVKFVEIGLLTPPIGMNAFIIKSAVGDQVMLGEIFRGISWFLMAEVLIMLLIIYFPKISLIIT